MKFGVIGWGLRRHLPQLAHKPDRGWELAGLADPLKLAQDRFREFVGPDCLVTEDYLDFLDKGYDGVFVLSPDWLHEEHAVTLLEAGIPVYLEKPMAITVEGCDRILEVAKRTGTKLYLGHNMRHFPVIRLMREWIHKGAIGNIQTAWCRHFVSYGGEAYYRDWHAERANTTGLLLQKGAHDIDVLHWLCDSYAKRASAVGKLAVYGDILDRQAPGEPMEVKFERSWPPRELKNLHPTVDVEDLNLVLLEMQSGVLASYQQCHFTPDAWRNYTIIGDAGRMENFGDGPGSTIRIWNRNHHGYSERGDIEIRVPESTGSHGGSDAAILEEFVRYLEQGGQTDTTPEAARMAVAVGVAATESVRQGGGMVDVR